MAYSPDLKQRILDFVASGGKITEAARLFKVHRTTINNWLAQPADHQPGKPGPKNSHKFDREDLRALLAHGGLYGRNRLCA